MRGWNDTPAVLLQLRAYFEHAFGKEGFEALSAVLSKPPLQTCLRVNTLKATPQVPFRHMLQVCCTWITAALPCPSSLHPASPPPLSPPSLLLLCVAPPLQEVLATVQAGLNEAAGHRAFLHPAIPEAVILQGSGPHTDIDYAPCGASRRPETRAHAAHPTQPA